VDGWSVLSIFSRGGNQVVIIGHQNIKGMGHMYMRKWG